MQTNDITPEIAPGARRLSPDPQVLSTRRATADKARPVVAVGRVPEGGKARLDEETRPSTESRLERCRYGAGF